MKRGLLKMIVLTILLIFGIALLGCAGNKKTPCGCSSYIYVSGVDIIV